jgi:hypothetical protein
MPDYYQADRAYGTLPNNGRSHCGPAAVSNALVWLDTHGFPNLLDAERPGPKEQFALIERLDDPQYMNTHTTKGTGPVGIMRGIEKYCTDRGYTPAIAYAGWRTRHRRVAERAALPWLCDGVRGGSSLLLNVGWYRAEPDGKTFTRVGGHWITAAGCERDGEGVTLFVHDPAKRTQKGKRDSIARCPVRCLLKPLPDDTKLLAKEGGSPVRPAGLYALDGLPFPRRKNVALAILDGAVAFTLECGASLTTAIQARQVP